MSNFLPSPLLKSLQETFDVHEEDFLAVHKSSEDRTSIRLNPDKPFYEDPANSSQIPWCENGRYLENRPIFTLDPFFHAGCYYVQEASSMFVSHIIKSLSLEKSALVALDLCAAPGGKSTLLSSELHLESLLISNEIIKSRAGVLSDNISKWGKGNTIVSNNDPKTFSMLPGYIDLLLIDAPCSGSGMFRKDPNTISEWSEAAVKLCSHRQKRILADSISALKESGILIYATCSYSKEENEDISDWLVETYNLESLAIPYQSHWGIIETRSVRHHCYGYRFYPHLVKGEGFFVTVFRKNEKQFTNLKRTTKRNTQNKNKQRAGQDIISNWLKQPSRFSPIPFKDELLAFPKRYAEDLFLLQETLYLKKAGINIGTLKGKDVIPHHELALSIELNEDRSPKLLLSKEDALIYLRKNELDIDTKLRGWALANYKGANLGWMKILPNRINNYLPKELRIQNL